MPEAEFDEIAAAYEQQHADSIRLSGEDTGYFADYKALDAKMLARKKGLSPQRILDFGSGIGNSVAPLRANFPDAEITCLDVSRHSLAMSRTRHGEEKIDYRHYDGTHIPHDLGQFDLIFTACVFHHIPPADHVALLAQLKRILRPNGMFVLFEHNPWNPLTVNAVNTCPFDENAILISAPMMRNTVREAGFASSAIRYRIFFPAALAALRPLEMYLTKMPLGAQYCLTAD